MKLQALGLTLFSYIVKFFLGKKNKVNIKYIKTYGLLYSLPSEMQMLTLTPCRAVTFSVV